LIAPFQQAIAGFATGAGLPARAEGLAIWIMGAAWLFLWAFGYRNEAAFEKIRSLRVYSLRGVLLALCLLLNSNFIALVQDLRVAPFYAAEQRQREALVVQQKAEGKTDVVVPSLTVKPKLLFFTDLRPSPRDWKNQSFAEYWGVQSVSALPKELLHDEKARQDFQEGKPSGLEALASAGDPEVQFALGEIYDTTFAPANDVVKDDATAAKWYRMAAEQGYAHAQRRLTRLYALGRGVPKSYFRAMGWLLRSQF
jgi:TPR repeat protein